MSLGEAYALGPNINDPITPEREAEANAALQKALAKKGRRLASGARFIDALTTRYTTEQNPDRRKFDAAFARAMQDVAKRYLDDPDVQTIYVASVMERVPGIPGRKTMSRSRASRRGWPTSNG